ncbi:MAG: hypothetical protein ABSH15_12735 [Verrucomicrobiota bacterium]|jgi:hypothetical protein
MPNSANPSEQLIAAARRLPAQVDCLKFKPPVTHVYNPLTCAWKAMWARNLSNLAELLEAAKAHDTNFVYYSGEVAGPDWSPFVKPHP